METFFCGKNAVYGIAADIFADYARKVCPSGRTDGEHAACFVLSSDLSRCPEPAVREAAGVLAGDEDEFLVASVSGKRDWLVFAGANERALLYAVYHYFEAACGCRWFWDGDVVRERDSLPVRGVFYRERPRFRYRAIRYFAHRGLTRFQAEHWGWEDWKREIDWLIKKKLNVFMLRTGSEDLFQRAFPDEVPYPDGETDAYPDKKGFDRRTPAWSLRYRGELKKRVLAYAFERGLMHPMDSGTMTHWYSPTPRAFLESMKPTFYEQKAGSYEGGECAVWDIREKRNFDFYCRLTDAQAETYGQAKLFHTIGFAERNFDVSRRENFLMKREVIGRFYDYVRAKYPGSVYLIASWDLWINFTPEEVRELAQSFSPESAVLWDYTSDGARSNNFTAWNLAGALPYTFGIFHAYSRHADLRGDYALTEARLKKAAADEWCRGMIFWPELSHSDTFMLEYFTANAWRPLECGLSERLDKYCADRYAVCGGEMREIWRDLFPLIECQHWNPGEGIANPVEAFFLSDWFYRVTAGDNVTHIVFYCPLEKTASCIPAALRALQAAREIARRAVGDPMTYRDLIDLVKTALSRFAHYAMTRAGKETAAWLRGENVDKARVRRLTEIARGLIAALKDVLALHEDYSLRASYERLRREGAVNPVFLDTLIENTVNAYHRSYVYEHFLNLYIPETDDLFALIEDCLEKEDRERFADRKSVLAMLRAHAEKVTRDNVFAEEKEKKSAEEAIEAAIALIGAL